MSCWVVPAVAAEMWGTTIGRVLEQARRGEVPSKTEYGFMLVDVAPHSPRFDSLTRRMIPPRTFVDVSSNAPHPTMRSTAATQSQLAEEVAAGEDNALPWRSTRQAVSQTRRKPQITQLTMTAAA